MSRARRLHRKENRPSGEEAASSSVSHVVPRDELRRHPQACEKLPEALEPDDLRGHDSIDWRVSDDWPEHVPITSDEIEVVEGFLGQILDDLLK
jgi:hypothetical protein